MSRISIDGLYFINFRKTNIKMMSPLQLNCRTLIELNVRKKIMMNNLQEIIIIAATKHNKISTLPLKSIKCKI
jgi:hypothetical protein